MDLITATAGKRAQAAARQLQGRLSGEIRAIRAELYNLLARLELALEYPDHEDSHDAQADLSGSLAAVMTQVASLAASFRQGRLLSEGFTVVIVGRPNAGKSSLLNTLAGFDRAIVTPVAGTTRDTVEEQVDIGGIPVRLIDTAGLRETSDLVERIGVDRARSAILEADLILWLISPPDDWTGDLSQLDMSRLDKELDELRDLAEKPKPCCLWLGKRILLPVPLCANGWPTNYLIYRWFHFPPRPAKDCLPSARRSWTGIIAQAMPKPMRHWSHPAGTKPAWTRRFSVWRRLLWNSNGATCLISLQLWCAVPWTTWPKSQVTWSVRL